MSKRVHPFIPLLAIGAPSTFLVGLGLGAWMHRRHAKRNSSNADESAGKSVAELVFQCSSFIPILAATVFGAIVLRGWLDQGYLPRDPFVGSNNDIPGRIEPEGFYGLHWPLTILFLVLAQASLIIYPGMIGYLVGCHRRGTLGFVFVYIVGYALLFALMLPSLGFVAWLID